jgi:hypothetical protein
MRIYNEKQSPVQARSLKRLVCNVYSTIANARSKKEAALSEPLQRGIHMGDCPHTSAPSSEELLEFAHEADSLPTEKRIHLEQCPTCQRQLREYLRLDNALVGRFQRRFCPNGIQISLYCENLLSPAEQSRIANHILDCPLCTLEVANTRRFLQETSLTLAKASLPFITNHRVFGILVKQQAQLVARSESNEAAEKAWPRQYHIDGIDLSLHLSRAGNGEQMLLGILTSTNNTEHSNLFEGAATELYTGGVLADLSSGATPSTQAQIDDLGNLLLRPVSSGEYVLLIHLPDRDIIIEHITID